MGIIYKATSPSGKVYIGKTMSSLAERKRSHKHSAYKKKSDGSYKYFTKFCNSIRKYGFENFTWEILHESNDEKVISALEEQEIRNYNSTSEGYNIEKSSTGSPRSEETKRKISEKLKGHKFFGDPNKNKYWLGKHRSEEIKNKISSTMKSKEYKPSRKAIENSIKSNIKTYLITNTKGEVVSILTKKGVYDYLKKINDDLGLKYRDRISPYFLLKKHEYKGYTIQRI